MADNCKNFFEQFTFCPKILKSRAKTDVEEPQGSRHRHALLLAYDFQELLLDEGINAEILRYSVPPEKREAWIRDKVDDGTQVVIANPKLVQTGLDLYDFPTLTFYQTGYSIYSLRQASRRSWRIGQDRDVKVYYVCYRPTLQERAMQLMGGKVGGFVSY